MGFDKESEMTILDEFIPVIENTFVDQPMSKEELPTFECSKSKLPQPLWDNHKDYIDDVIKYDLIQTITSRGYMEELYKFYLEDETYGEELMNNFLESYPKFIKGKNDYKVASKSGWAGTAIHDVSIVFADNPYIVVALSNLGESDYYTSYFNKANDLAYRLHTEYWKYKISMCNDISQY